MATPGKSVTVTGSKARITFADTDDWGSGFIGSVSLTNLQATAMGASSIRISFAARSGESYDIERAEAAGAFVAGGSLPASTADGTATFIKERVEIQPADAAEHVRKDRAAERERGFPPGVAVVSDHALALKEYPSRSA